MSYRDDSEIRYQYKDVDPFAPRTLLGLASESAARTDIERTYLKKYQSILELVDVENENLFNLIMQKSHCKGLRNFFKSKKLLSLENQTRERIDKYEEELSSLEATKPLVDIAERELSFTLAKRRQEYFKSK